MRSDRNALMRVTERLSSGSSHLPAPLNPSRYHLAPGSDDLDHTKTKPKALLIDLYYKLAVNNGALRPVPPTRTSPPEERGMETGIKRR